MPKMNCIFEQINVLRLKTHLLPELTTAIYRKLNVELVPKQILLLVVGSHKKQATADVQI